MIKSVHLKNFKCFKDQLLLTKPITLLSGVNGMGKSTFIQSLLSVRQSYMQNILPKIGLSLNGDLIKLGTAKDVLFEYANEEEISLDIDFADGKSGHFSFDYNQSSEVLPVKEHKVAEGFFKQGLFTDNFHYLSAERIGPRLAFEMSDFHVAQHRQIGSSGQYTAHFLAMYGSQALKVQSVRWSNATSDTLSANVEAWLGAISPGTRLLVTPHPGMSLVNLEYSFARGNISPTKNHRPTNVGFGITFILPVLVGLLSAEPGSILLIENPEAHLHPKGQFMLGRLMALAAQGGVQIIVESHSDHFLNGIRVAVKERIIEPSNVSLNYFDFDPPSSSSKIKNLELDIDGRINQWPEGFFDEWEKSLERLL